MKNILKISTIIYAVFLLIYAHFILSSLFGNFSKQPSVPSQTLSTDNITSLISTIFGTILVYFTFFQGLGLLILSFLTRKILVVAKLNIILSTICLISNIFTAFALMKGLGYSHQKLGGFNTPQDDWWNALYWNLNLISVGLNLICPLIICFLVLKTAFLKEALN